MLKLEEVVQFARESLRIAREAVETIQMSENVKYAKHLSTISDIPRFRRLKTGWGEAAWAAIVFVDLRNSSQRADIYGPRTTYLILLCNLFPLIKPLRR